MTRPRRHIVSPSITPWYHITCRCIRGAFLCGYDKHEKKCYEHRRQWIVDRFRILASVFTINIGAYAVMSNHYHLVVKINEDAVKEWEIDEIIQRWTTIFKGPLLIQKYLDKEPLSTEELQIVHEIAEVWRKRLCCLSWFMKCLNEPIAKQANQEDEVTGHFWQARFTSQALDSEAAVLSCMAYVDLNPIRAKKATTPETSKYTSIQERITPQFDLQNAIKEQTASGLIRKEFKLPLRPLLHFEETLKDKEQTGILFSFKDYLTLVDETGKIIRHDKRGSIHEKLSPILSRLNIDKETWLNNTTAFEYHQRRRRRPKRSIPLTA